MDTTTILIISLGGVAALILILGTVYFIMSSKEKKRREAEALANSGPMVTRTISNVPMSPMAEFLEFDEVKDNMIIRKNKTQYVMVIQCQGVNYDLLSGDEKLAVEEGFIQFLNTLRFPIQLYVQTRTLNLKDIVEDYRKRMHGMREEIDKLNAKLEQVKRTGNIDAMEKIEFEIRRKENVLAYGIDVSEYISRLSLNSNILQQRTYIVVSYYAAEAGEFSAARRDDMDSVCFSELYTRCQSIIRTLSSAEVFGRILESEELAELLYIAYNRADSENLQLSKVLDAEYDSLYSTGKDILLKKQEKLDEQIQIEAIELATESILESDRKRQEDAELRRIQIEEKAMQLLDGYKEQMDPELYEGAQKEVKKRKVTKINKKQAS